MNELVEGDRSGVTVVGAPYAPRRLQVWGYSKSLDARNRLRPSALAVTPLALTSMGFVLRRQIKKQRPDVVHLHWALPQGLLAAVVPGEIPIVISIHGADARLLRTGLGSLARPILSRADALVAASTGVLSSVAENYPEARAKSHVIPHGVDPKLFRMASKISARRALGIDKEASVVLAVGRLVSEKGFDTLIDAMPLLSDKTVLVIAGEGPDRSRLQARASPLGTRVRLVGKQTRDEVAQWFAACDVAAVVSKPETSDAESGPVVLMEALASGRPVVATRVGMAPDVIEDGVNGYLLSSVSVDSIASAVELTLRDSARLGHGASKTFESVGGWDRVARQLESLYESVSTAKSSLPT